MSFMKLSILCPSRPNSEYLSHFLFSVFTKTQHIRETEVLVMLNKKEKWNLELVKFFEGKVSFFYEDSGLGRWGLHQYYNTLVKHAVGDWIALMCEDFDIVMDGWDEFMYRSAAEKCRDPYKINVLLPRFVGSIGNVCQVLSRGYVEAVGGNLSEHSSIDSWINAILDRFPENRKMECQQVMLDDYTHTVPSKGNNPGGTGCLPTTFLTDEEARAKRMDQAERLLSAIGAGR
jgi:hypothetical protein